MKRYRSARDVLADIERAIAAAKPAAKKSSALDDVLDVLYEGRHYFWIGIYFVLGQEVRRQAFRGPAPPCHTFAIGKGNVGTTPQRGVTKVIPDVAADATYSMCFLEVKSEIVVPIKIAGRILGVIDVESDQPNRFGRAERILLEKVAQKLARFLTAKGKYLVRKAREKAAAEARAAKPASDDKRLPVSEKFPQAIRRAAAGDGSRK